MIRVPRKPSKDHLLWLECEKLAQIEWKSKMEKHKRELIRKQKQSVSCNYNL